MATYHFRTRGVFVIYLTKSSCDFGFEQWWRKGKAFDVSAELPVRRYVGLLLAQKGASEQGWKLLPVNSFPFV